MFELQSPATLHGHDAAVADPAERNVAFYSTARDDLHVRYWRPPLLEGDFLFEPVTNEEGRVVGIEIACCGDGALMALIDSLGFALEALTDEC